MLNLIRALPTTAHCRAQALVWSFLIATLFILLSPQVLLAQSTVRPYELPLSQSSQNSPTVITYYEFEFARMYYDGGYEWPRWRADYPHAEFHFSNGLRRLTRIQVSDESQVLRATDQALFDYPWLYVVEVGHWRLSVPELEQLREYLLRGGFLVVDDFHGTYEWAQFSSVVKQLFPTRSLVPLPSESSLFDIHFDVSDMHQIPGIRSVMNGRTWEKGGITPGWFGIFDDEGRVMVVVNFNQDIGDAWEHADDAIYPEAFTSQAYRLGVNYVLYAMTH